VGFSVFRWILPIKPRCINLSPVKSTWRRAPCTV